MSIKQNAYAGALPDFRNLGILLRILLIVDGLSLAVALLGAPTWRALYDGLLDISATVQPVLLASLLTLSAASPLLRRLPYAAALATVFALELAVATAVYLLGQGLFKTAAALDRYWLFTLLATGLLAGYFNLRARALSPALSEARLQALQARIRPHFLFNSINAVLGVIRSNPQQAENALEDMAELFRVLMADNRELTPLAHEITLCRQYLGLEQLRLGERLRMEWDLDESINNALVPPLVLQPLLENAVYHGVEPRAEPGTVRLTVRGEGERLQIVLSNPFRPGQSDHHAGNRMALANIRERLLLHFDVEASIRARASDEQYEVRIDMPYVKNTEAP